MVIFGAALLDTKRHCVSILGSAWHTRMTPMNPRSKVVTRTFKVVGYLTALLTLAFGLSRIWVTVANHHHRQRQVEERLTVTKVQVAGADYADAWETLSEAEAIALTDEVRLRQEDVAMAWLRSLNLDDLETISDVVGRVLPVLTRGVTLRKGVRRADLLAHVGWANYLRYDAEGTRSDFGRYYDMARAIDPTNPYANAFAGYCVSGSVETAKVVEYFNAALPSGRETRLIRRLELSAFLNCDDRVVELVRLASDLVEDAESTPGNFASVLWTNVYKGSFQSEHARETILGAVPPAKHIAIFQSFFGPGSRAYREDRWERDLWLAHILNREGLPQDAVNVLVQTPRTDQHGTALPEFEQAWIDAAITQFNETAQVTH